MEEEQDIESAIEKGLQQKRIEAFIVNQIHKITTEYDPILLQILHECKFLLKEPTNPMTDTITLCLSFQDFIQHLITDLWEHWVEKDYVAKCIHALSYIRISLQSYDYKYLGYEYNEFKLFKFITRSFYHSRTLLGIYGSEFIGKMIDDKFHQRCYQLQISKYNTEVSISPEPKKQTRSYNKQDKTNISSTQFYIFSFMNQEGKQIEIKLHSKIRGVQFGGIFEIVSPIPKKYFCKGYWGYPFIGKFNSPLHHLSLLLFLFQMNYIIILKKKIYIHP